MSTRPLLALLAFTFVAPATAHAGTYHVYTCVAAGRTWTNNAWKTDKVAGVNKDSSCSGNTIALSVPAGARMANNTSSALSFTSPASTTIADFALTRQVGYDNPVEADTHRYYVLYSLGSTAFAGAGNYADATRNALNAQKHWYGYPEGNASVAKSTVRRSTFPALASYPGNARQLFLRVGCYNRGTPCSVAAGGAISHVLHGADVTINDPTPPAVTVEGSGLLAAGGRNGSEPVTLTASDSAGIRKVELIDVTNPLAPTLIGAEDYGVDRTDGNRVCDYSRPAPCPSLTRETVRAATLQTGQRAVAVRVTDAGGNVVRSGPYPVFAVTASDRGAPNGSNVTESGTLTLRWTAGGSKRRTLSFGRKAGIRGRLLNSSGQPIAGARVTLLTRDLRRDARLVERETLVTDAGGEFRTTVAATASRLLQFGWLPYANDIRFGANGYLTLQARADARIAVSTRRPRVGRAFTVSGRLRGVSRGGVPVIVQGRASGARRFTTFADTTSSSSGRFRVHYRFKNSGSRGRRFEFRARIRPAARFPYETGYSRSVTVRPR
jgi:hypothetical protein